MINKASVLSLSGAILLALCLQGYAQQLCDSQRTCRDCISTLDCSWCTDMAFNGTSRCSSNSNSTSCTLVENPSGSVGNETRNIGEENPVNIKNIDLNLRVGQAQEFNVNITALRNLPLDLYILMDLSASMDDVLISVKEVAGNISQSILDITNNVQIGFGTFNEKNLLPFTNPAFPGGQEPPYAFRHHLDFTNNTSNTSEFQRVINDIFITTNLDTSENTLEALAQVISCDGLLGWRSRNNTQVARLVLIMTDQGFHFSGEGKLAGILNPYLGDCLLDRMPGMEQIDLVKFDQVDYPSVGQIVELIRSQDINVIFSVADPVQPTYEQLVSFTNGRATVARLNTAGSGAEILNTIGDEYRMLLREIRLELLDPSDQFSIVVTPMCPASSTLTDDGNGCNEVQLDSSVLFTVSVTLNNCNGLFDGETKVLTFESRAFGTFTVTVRGVCRCGCQDEEVPNAPQCSGNGVFSCGVCECNDGYCGTTCSLIDPSDGGGTNMCPRDNGAFNNLTCSGRGICNCVCDCPPGTSGLACECDVASELPQCKSAENEVCSGRGECCNKACRCGMTPLGNPYRGNSTHSLCQCEPAVEVCNYRGTECNGQGQRCDCDGCVCLQEWEGQFCEIPRVTRCEVALDRDCIRDCRAAGEPDVCDMSVVPACNENRPTIFVNTADIDMDTDDAILRIANSRLDSPADFTLGGVSLFTCSVTNEADCMETYYILDNGTHNAVVVERGQACPPIELPIPVWAIALISLGLLMLVGILIIILVKIIFVILDYIEVQRWQREAGEADFSKNQNPLYQSPEMEYTNVAYGKPL